MYGEASSGLFGRVSGVSLCSSQVHGQEIAVCVHPSVLYGYGGKLASLESGGGMGEPTFQYADPNVGDPVAGKRAVSCSGGMRASRSKLS